jgi:hypothetical protein
MWVARVVNSARTTPRVEMVIQSIYYLVSYSGVNVTPGKTQWETAS